MEQDPLTGLRVCLVFPNVALERTAALQQNVHALGAIQPLSLLYVAGILEEAGAHVSVIDATARGLSPKETSSLIKAFRPDVVGWTLATLDFAYSLDWIRTIRQYIDVPVLVGGIHLSSYPLETLTHTAIDWGVVRDAEQTVVDLLWAWRKGDDLGEVAGIVYRKEGIPTLTASRSTWMEVDKTALPARHLVHDCDYRSILAQREGFTAIMSGWGCPFSCSFCVLPTVPVRLRTPRVVADEMEYCLDTLGIEEFDFFDPSFCLGHKRVRDLCSEFRSRGLHKRTVWSARARADQVTLELLQDMASAGCVRICLGLESGNIEILKGAEKLQGGPDRMRQAVDWGRQAGLEVMAFFTIGHKGETTETIEQTRSFILSLDLDFIQVAPIFMLPGSSIHEDYVERTGDDFWRRNTLEPQPLLELPLLDCNLSTAELKAHAVSIYRSFYFRPRQVLRGLSRMRNIGDVSRAIRASNSLLRLGS
jgi:radical SAM superfamily enzyme YgiQ (UPF0313 family)